MAKNGECFKRNMLCVGEILQNNDSVDTAVSGGVSHSRIRNLANLRTCDGGSRRQEETCLPCRGDATDWLLEFDVCQAPTSARWNVAQCAHTKLGRGTLHSGLRQPAKDKPSARGRDSTILALTLSATNPSFFEITAVPVIDVSYDHMSLVPKYFCEDQSSIDRHSTHFKILINCCDEFLTH